MTKKFNLFLLGVALPICRNDLHADHTSTGAERCFLS